MNSVQCRMARAALEWTSRQLASAANVPAHVAHRFQSGQSASMVEIGRMQSALEAAGVIFIEENGEGVGVRMKKST